MATRWLLDLLSLRHPQESTKSRTSSLSNVQWYFRCVSSVARATPGWPEVVWTSARMPGVREQEMVRRRTEPGGAYQKSPPSSGIYTPPISPLSRSCIFPNKWESSFCCFVSSYGLRSKPAIRCPMVGYRPRCSP